MNCGTEEGYCVTLGEVSKGLHSSKMGLFCLAEWSVSDVEQKVMAFQVAWPTPTDSVPNMSDLTIRKGEGVLDSGLEKDLCPRIMVAFGFFAELTPMVCACFNTCSLPSFLPTGAC